jgi:hypothetical protein
VGAGMAHASTLIPGDGIGPGIARAMLGIDFNVFANAACTAL